MAIYFAQAWLAGANRGCPVHNALHHLHIRGEVFRFGSEMLTAEFGLKDYLLPRFPAFTFSSVRGSSTNWFERLRLFEWSQTGCPEPYAKAKNQQ
jgi:hypothetical protein